MNLLTKRIALLVSLFFLAIGFFLLGYNLRLISEEVKDTALNLWPVLLIIAGIMLVVDSTRKRSFSHSSGIRTKQLPLPFPPQSDELACKVLFSYGRLVVGVSGNGPRLVTEQVELSETPSISHQLMGGLTELAIEMSQPLFPSHFQLRNTWRLELIRAVPLRLSLNLHEVDLLMDLRKLSVESLDIHADSGEQEILLGKPLKKLRGQIYSSSTNLAIIFPAGVFVHVRLLNPFCRVDYPQGDLEKRQDGSLVSPSSISANESIEISIDGPIRNLVIDVEEAPAEGSPADTGVTARRAGGVAEPLPGRRNLNNDEGRATLK